MSVYFIQGENVIIMNKNDENMPNLVKYDNDFILTSRFNQLSSVQQDIFFSAVSFLCRNKATHVVIPASVIKERANLMDKNYTRDAYYALLHDLEDIILQTIFFAHFNGEEWKGSLFNTFAINDKTGDFKMFLNPNAAHYFFQIPGPFSRFELQAFMRLNSKYAKNLFRVLLAKYNGIWNPDSEELIATFGLKSKKQIPTLLHRMDKYIEEIKNTGYFTDITFTILRDNTRRGRPLKSVHFEFIFSLKKRAEIKDISRSWADKELSFAEKSYTQEDDGLPQIGLEQKKNKETGEILPVCPYCGSQFIYSHNPKMNKNFIGHIDYETSKCKLGRKTFDSMNDLKAFLDVEKKKIAHNEVLKSFLAVNPIAQKAAKAEVEQKKDQELTKLKLMNEEKQNNNAPIENYVDDPDAPFPVG